MSSFTPRAARLLKAIDFYSTNFRRWDSLHLMPKIKIMSAGNGVMEGVFEVTEEMCNCAGTLHGAFISSIMDYISTYSIMQHPKGAIAWTTNMNISFLSLTGKGERVLIDCKPISITKSRIVTECNMIKARNSTLLAQGTVGFALPTKPMVFLDVLPFDPRIEDK